jgi:hypothetical protein
MGNAYLEMGQYKDALECHNKDYDIGHSKWVLLVFRCFIFLLLCHNLWFWSVNGKHVPNTSYCVVWSSFLFFYLCLKLFLIFQEYWGVWIKSLGQPGQGKSQNGQIWRSNQNVSTDNDDNHFLVQFNLMN